jgi:O-antigen ligase
MLPHATLDRTTQPAISKLNYIWVQWLLAATFLLFLLSNTPFKKPIYVLLLTIYLLLIFTKSKVALSLITASPSLVMLWILLCASYFWSVVPGATAEAIMSQSVFWVFALSIAANHQMTGFAKSLQGAALILVCLVVLYCLAFPGASLSSAGLKAFYVHKNLLGGIMALTSLILVFAPNRNKWHIGFGLVAIGLLLASHSKTAIILFFGSAMLLPLASWWAKHFYPKSRHMMVKDAVRYAIFSMILVGLFALVIFRNEFLNLILHYLPKTALTGRGQLWLVVIQQMSAHSLLGIGPGTFWQAGAASEIAQTALYRMDPYWVQHMISSDGSYVDLAASLGVLGLAIFLLTAIDLYRRLFRNWHQADSRLIFILVTFVLLQAITESTILYSTNIQWLIYLLSYFRVAGYANMDLSLQCDKQQRCKNVSNI